MDLDSKVSNKLKPFLYDNRVLYMPGPLLNESFIEQPNELYKTKENPISFHDRLLWKHQPKNVYYGRPSATDRRTDGRTV